MLNGEQVIEGLRELGIGGGNLILVHSSFKAFGGVEGGPVEVAKALVEAVGPKGTAVVPTFNFGKGVYDPKVSESVTGAICDAFWKLPGAVRSLQETHPFAAVGAEAEELMAGHERAHPFGVGSPIWKLWERDAWVVLMGVDHRRSSMIHVAEEMAGVPQVNRTRVGRSVGKNGEVVERIVRRPGCSEGFNKVDRPLREREGIRDVTIGGARVMGMRAKVLVEVAEGMLRADAGALFCDDSACVRCIEGREMVRLG